MSPIKQGPPAIALIRALGVTDTKSVRRVTLNIEVGKLATIEVERLVDSSINTRVEQLQLYARLPAEQLKALADEPDAAGSDMEAAHVAG